MQFIGIDNKIYGVDIIKYKNNKRSQVSSYHKQVRDLLDLIYKFEIIIEEFPLPGTKPKLYADFFIPQHKKIIEIHGEQHYSFNSHFYSCKRDFLKAKQRDQIKQDWCNLNKIEYIELKYDEDWTSKLKR